MKKSLLKTAFVALAAFMGVGNATAAVGDVTSILNQTFAEGTTLTNTSEYTWGEGIQDMQKKYTETKDNKTQNGLLLTNEDNAANNYQDRVFLTFTNPVGGDTQQVNIVYDLWSYKDFQKPSATVTMAYYNADGNLIFSIEEVKGVDWGFESYINYTTSTGVGRAKLTHKLAKNSTLKIPYSVKFSGNQAVVTIDGASYVAQTTSVGIKQIKLSYTGAGDSGRGWSLLNYSVSTTEMEAVQPADYTLNYVCDNATIKTVVKTGVVGAEIVLTAEETANMVIDDVKYIFVSSDVEGKTVTKEGTTVTLTYRKAETYAYTVKTSNPETTLAEGSDYEGNNIKVFYPRYMLLEDGTLTTKNANSNEYSQSFTLTENNMVETWAYSNANIADVVFLAEAEKIEGMTPSDTHSNRTSCGFGAFASSDVNIVTLEPGKYKLTVSTRSNVARSITFNAGTKAIYTFETVKGNTGGGTSEEFIVRKASPLVLKAYGDAANLVDYLYVQKTGEYVAVPAEYTIKYVAGETTLKEAKVEGDAGDDIVLTEEQLAEFSIGRATYKCVSNDAEGKTIAEDGSTVITVVCEVVPEELGAQYTILNQAFNGDTTLEDTDLYTWGADIQGMIQSNGIYVTNQPGGKTNYENRDFITFVQAEGDATHELNIAYTLYSAKDKEQDNTYYTTSFFNNEGEFVFGIQEWSGGWNYGSNIILATADATSTVALAKGHMKKDGGETVNIAVKFDSNNAIISIDGATYIAYTKSEGIKAVKLSVSGGDGYNRDEYIKDFSVKTTFIEAVKVADYTLKYVVGETTVKTETKSGIVGDAIALLANDTANFFNEDKTMKYIYVSNDAEGKTVTEEGTVITLVYREAALYSYTVSTSNPTKQLAEGTAFEGESVSVYYPQYLLSGSQLHMADPVNKEYLKTFVVDADEKTITISYYAPETPIENIVFYTEAEDIEGATVSSNKANRTSCGLGAYAENDLTVTTLEPGIYVLFVSTRTNQEINFTFKAGAETIFNMATAKGNTALGESNEFTLKAPTAITLAAGGSADNLVDFLYIQKTGDVEVTGVEEIGADGNDADMWFNLQGIRVVRPTATGVYIHNGKKVYVK